MPAPPLPGLMPPTPPAPPIGTSEASGMDASIRGASVVSAPPSAPAGGVGPPAPPVPTMPPDPVDGAISGAVPPPLSTPPFPALPSSPVAVFVAVCVAASLDVAPPAFTQRFERHESPGSQLPPRVQAPPSEPTGFELLPPPQLAQVIPTMARAILVAERSRFIMGISCGTLLTSSELTSHYIICIDELRLSGRWCLSLRVSASRDDLNFCKVGLAGRPDSCPANYSPPKNIQYSIDGRTLSQTASTHQPPQFCGVVPCPS